jgi:hypothetical protein
MVFGNAIVDYLFDINKKAKDTATEYEEVKYHKLGSHLKQTF